MKSLIEDIYFGRRRNEDTVCEGEKYRKVREIAGKQYKKLKTQLTDKQKMQLDELYSIMGELESEHGISRFKEGFKFGLLVAIEMFLE